MQDFVSAANDLGATVSVTVDFAARDRESMEEAISRVADADARIVLCVADGQDVADLSETADSYGMIQAGYAWIIPFDIDFGGVISASPDPATTQDRLAGWLSASYDPVYSDRGSHFKAALTSQPLETLTQDIMAGNLSEDVLNTPCDQYCAAIYDAVPCNACRAQLRLSPRAVVSARRWARRARCARACSSRTSPSSAPTPSSLPPSPPRCRPAPRSKGFQPKPRAPRRPLPAAPAPLPSTPCCSLLSGSSVSSSRSTVNRLPAFAFLPGAQA